MRIPGGFLSPPFIVASPFACCSHMTSFNSLKWRACSRANFKFINGFWVWVCKPSFCLKCDYVMVILPFRCSQGFPFSGSGGGGRVWTRDGSPKNVWCGRPFEGCTSLKWLGYTVLLNTEHWALTHWALRCFSHPKPNVSCWEAQGTAKTQLGN